LPFHFASVIFFAITAVGFVFISLLGGSFLRPDAPTPEKKMIYECGEKPIGNAWYNFNPRFYLVALVFVIFEVEIALMFPVAAVYRSWVETNRGGLAFLEIFAFVAILAVGLAYVWVKGDLDWVKKLSEDVLRPSPGNQKPVPAAPAKAPAPAPQVEPHKEAA
jgi:NADH-quinone oxidoreductase subunit A